MSMQELWSDHHGVWTGIYKSGAVVLFGAAMFGLGASAGTALFHVPALWQKAAIAQNDAIVVPKLAKENWTLKHEVQTAIPSVATKPKDCPQ